MAFTLSVPSKTFLFGEYITLNGGAALILNTEPRFSLTARAHANDQLIFHGIATESPAGKFLNHFKVELQGYEFTFQDPYHGAGGFGASSAQFALALIARDIIVAYDPQYPWEGSFAPAEVINTYRQFAWDQQGLPPSGADVIAQLCGDVTYYHPQQHKLVAWDWPFADLEFHLIRTGNKIATHQHLKQLSSTDYPELEKIALAGVQAFETKQSQAFSNAIQQYGACMQAQNLVTETTLTLLKRITSQSQVIAAKGCGALGADVILALTPLQESVVFSQWLTSQQLELVAKGTHASTGLLFCSEEK